MTESQIVERIAFYGEQVLSFLDELSRMQCPKCGLQELTISLSNRSLIIQCSSDLANDPDIADRIYDICNFIKTIRPVNVTLEPFNLKFSPTEKRATKTNRLPAKRPRGRRKTNGV